MLNPGEFEIKALSSLEKVFHDDDLSTKKEITSFIMYKNQKLCYQIAYLCKTPIETVKRYPRPKISFTGSLAKYASVRQVQSVANLYPVNESNVDDDYIRRDVGLYPDVLENVLYGDSVTVPCNIACSLWINVDLPKNFKPGDYDLTLNLDDVHTEYSEHAEKTVKIKVLSCELPKQKTIHTEWFYTDCIAQYHNVKAFSKEHFRLIGEYMKVAVENGINMILTPVFTPELDTYVGGERLTTQLVDIELTGDETYAFGFKKLHQWIDLCLKCGVHYFEIPNFFTQWGAKAAPKIIVKVNGRRQKYFGWHTESTGEKYKNFLAQFIPALVAEFKQRGLDHKCFYHISDEPNINALDHYRQCKEMVAPYLEGYPIIDALSELEFYTSGAIDKPVPNTRSAHKFHEAGVPGLWTYYCGGGRAGVADRSISMPTHRTRMLGVQLYYYNIEGFLHWGYNFYNTRHSYSVLDPYSNPDGSYFNPSGDCFLVYPGLDGEAWPSLRLNALREAMDDIRALRLYESRFGRAAAEALILEGTDGTFTFTHYPTDPLYLTNLREKIAAAFTEE